MLKIIKHVDYLEATFLGGNLYAFNINDLLSQLITLYGFKPLQIFTFDNLN